MCWIVDHSTIAFFKYASIVQKCNAVGCTAGEPQ